MTPLACDSEGESVCPTQSYSNLVRDTETFAPANKTSYARLLQRDLLYQALFRCGDAGIRSPRPWLLTKAA